MLIKGNESYKGLSPKTQEKIIPEVAYYFGKILFTMGFDLSDPHLKDSPNRMAKSLVTEYCKGNYEKAPNVTVFPNDDKIDHIIISKKIDVRSMCSHHFAPFFGHAYIGYIPNQKLVGLSKFARIVNWYSRRPQVQESIGEQVANHFMAVVKPLAFAIVIEATHTCTTLRGAEQSLESSMKTAVMRGGFAEDMASRMEFYELIKQH